jgi:hypothetical protein
MHVPLLALPALVARLADLAGPWQSLYADSKVVSAGVNFVHVGGMLVGGGLALGADRQTLRAAHGTDADRARQLGELRGVHRTVVAALALVALSGVGLFLADVEEFAGSGVYWLKMALVALLLVNGAFMTRTEASLAADAPTVARWGRLRGHAIASVLLWILILLAGVVLREG